MENTEIALKEAKTMKNLKELDMNNTFMGYSNGCKNILWDKHGAFDKWSRCNEILKTESVNKILKILKSKI